MAISETQLPAQYVPRIHKAVVTRVESVTPGMVRVWFGGPDLVDYPTTGIGDEYVRMFFPDHPHAEVRLPQITSVRGWEYPDGVEPSAMRVYTIRVHQQGEVAVDFVTHEGGVAAAWAMAARPGMAVGINPPYGLYERADGFSRQILVADEPAIPAALRIAELTSGLIETVVLCEVRDGSHKVFAQAAGVEYVWLEGSGNGVAASHLVDSLQGMGVDESTFVWVSTEGKTNRAVRKYLRKELGLPGKNYNCMAYWQERAEVWREKFDQLGPQFTSKLHEIYGAADLDQEEIDDEVEELYEAVGL